jgi:uncharacterized repeat protein (TIGR02543 family)
VLTATPASGYTFSGWSGACTGTSTCSVTMSAAKAVTATFTAVAQTQTLSLSVSGTGSVSSSPTGVSCSNTTSPCAASLASGTYVLTAAAGTGYTFTGWGGACSGTGTCSVSMSAAQSVTATFTVTTQTLSLTMTGSGTVSSSPTGVSCTASCSAALTSGNTYVLTAQAATGYTFSGWSGACTGTSTCSVAMNAAQAVTATFTATATGTQTLNVTVSGTGSAVASGVVSCSTGTCSTSVASGTVVSLTATPATGWKFSAWSGCTSTSGNTCSVTVSAAKTVTAAFVVDTAAAGCSITRGSTTATPVYPTTHPKVFLSNSQTLTCLQGLMSANGTAAARFKSFVDTEVAGGVNTYNQFGYDDWHAALMYRLTGTASYGDFAVQRVEKMILAEEAEIAAGNAAGVSGDSYLYVGPTIANVALVYDWCYERLTASQRTRWVAYMNQAVYNVWNPGSSTWGGISQPWSGWANTDPYNNYHYSFLKATMLAGLSTYSTNGSENSRASEWITMFRTTRIANDLLPAFNQNLPQGGSLEGTSYGTALRELFMLFDWWERSTGERIAPLTTHTLGTASWMMHAVVPTTTSVMSMGDQSRDSMAPFFDYHRELLLNLIALYPDERISAAAKLMLDSSVLTSMAYRFMSFADFIYQPPTLVSTSITDLSTAWYGAGVGHLMMRGAWGDQNATYGLFSCGLQWESHQHFDQGAFQLYRGEWLAPTGNRFTRSGIDPSVQSNNLTRFVDSAGDSIQQTGTNCTMQAVGDNDHYTYGLALITPAYNVYDNNFNTFNPNPNIQKSEREFVFIKPSTFVVFDRAVATSSSIKRVWTVNVDAVNTPTINGDQFTLVGSGGNRMDIYRVAPTGLTYTVNATHSAANGDLNVTTGRRVDVVDSTGTSSTFLHVISTSSSSASSSVSSVARNDATGQTGVTVNLADGRVAIIRFSTTGTGGTLELRNAAGTVLRSGALPTSVTVPPIFKN